MIRTASAVALFLVVLLAPILMGVAQWPDFIPPEPIAFEALVHGLPLPASAGDQTQFNSNSVNGDSFCMRDKSCRYILSVVDPNQCAAIPVCRAQMIVENQALARLSDRERTCRLDEQCVAAVATARGLR